MEQLINKIHIKNAFDLLAEIPDKSVQMVFSDPPYSEQAHNGARRNKEVNGKNGKKQTTIEFPPFTNRELVKYYQECERICTGWIINFHAFTHVVKIQNWLNTGKVVKGLDFVRAGVWDKKNTECPQLSGDRPAMGWECIAMVHNDGKKKWGEFKRKNSVYHYNTCSDKIGSHPTPKPVNLCAEIIKNFSIPGDIIVDAFSGSGRIPLAALRCGRKFIASEMDATHHKNACTLIDNEINGNMLYMG